MFERDSMSDLAPLGLDSGASDDLARVKHHVLQDLIWHAGADLPGSIVRQAVNEAESLAILTPLPALFLPLLAEEKLRQVRRWYLHQVQVRAHGQEGEPREQAFAE
jgi:hypothetical protein